MAWGSNRHQPLGLSVAQNLGHVIITDDLNGTNSHEWNLEELANAAVVPTSAVVWRQFANAVVVVIVIDAELCLLTLITFGLFVPASETESLGKVVYITICSRTMSHPKAMFFGNASAGNIDVSRGITMRPNC